MNHLTVEEIIGFVSFEDIDTSALELSKKVNSHIRCCDKCLSKVRAFQLIYDRLRLTGRGKEIGSCINSAFSGMFLSENELKEINGIFNRKSTQE